jgi:hypothetical protein
MPHQIPTMNRVIMEPAMINWPEMLRYAEDWADRFCAAAATALLIVIAGGMMVLFVRGI